MRYCDMTPQQQGRAKKLANRLCEKAAGKNQVLEQECASCESPCGYGAELLSLLGMERPRPLRTADVFASATPGHEPSVRRIMAAMNRRLKK